MLKVVNFFRLLKHQLHKFQLIIGIYSLTNAYGILVNIFTFIIIFMLLVQSF